MAEDFEIIKRRAQAAWLGKLNSNATRVIVGMGGCSIAVGASSVKQALEREIKRAGTNAVVEKTGCNGMCHKEVLVDVVKPGKPRVSYGNVTPAAVPSLVREAVVGDGIFKDLAVGVDGSEAIDGVAPYAELPFIKHQQRILTRNWGVIDPDSIDDYIANGGYAALVKALREMKPEDIIGEVKKSNMLGRGGAAFPTGEKWDSCRKVNDYPKYVICNGEEGEPAIFKDRRLLEADPHSVIEGMLICALAIGSDRGYMYIGGEHLLAIERTQRALKQAEEYGLLGKNILGSDFSFKLTIRKGAGSYACGESSALMSSIEGKRAMPRVKLVRSTERGLWAKPTNMNNVESYANIPQIIDKGGDWYAGIGTETGKGTKLFALSGNVVNTGLVEVPIGTTLRQLVYDIGDGIPNGKGFKVAQPGGPSGGCLPASLIDTPMDFKPLQKVGSTMGSGGLVIMDDDACIIDLAKWFLDFDREESCGRCTSCRIGSQRMYDILDAISNGDGRPSDLEMLEILDETVRETSLCGLGQAAAMFTVSTIRHFPEEYHAHIVEKRCPTNVCPALSREASRA
ncbi:MAG: SLBB domain-containing protein [Chloroflexi bacterium]|nr:SLBB domain-containing protein [Chloroflexota bacterium]